MADGTGRGQQDSYLRVNVNKYGMARVDVMKDSAAAGTTPLLHTPTFVYSIGRAEVLMVQEKGVKAWQREEPPHSCGTVRLL